MIDLMYPLLVREVAEKLGDERASKCGYDLLMGFRQGEDEAKRRLDAWKRYLKEVENKQSHTDENRDGVWVPATEYKP